jgi:hypothetical protein
MNSPLRRCPEPGHPAPFSPANAPSSLARRFAPWYRPLRVSEQIASDRRIGLRHAAIGFIAQALAQRLRRAADDLGDVLLTDPDTRQVLHSLAHRIIHDKCCSRHGGNEGGRSGATTRGPAHDDCITRWRQAQLVEPRRSGPCAGNRQDAAGNRRCMQGRSPQPCRRRPFPAQAGGPHRRARWETLRHTVNEDGATGRALIPS